MNCYPENLSRWLSQIESVLNQIRSESDDKFDAELTFLALTLGLVARRHKVKSMKKFLDKFLDSIIEDGKGSDTVRMQGQVIDPLG